MDKRENISESKYPRLLIIAPAVFNLYTGAGVTFTNLFKGWPKDRIAMVYSDTVERDESVCENFYRLTNKDFRWIYPFSIVQNFLRRYCQCKTDSICSKTLKWWFKLNRLIFGDEIPKAGYLCPELEEWLKDFKPQVIYSAIACSTFYIDLTMYIANKFKIPVVTHMMDDWPSITYRRGLFGPYLRWRLQKSLKKLLELSVVRMGICGFMCEAYKKRYKLEFTPFHNAIDVSMWRSKIRKDRMVNKPFKIIYHGSIVPYSHLNSLIDICRAAENLNNKGLEIDILIHTPRLFADLFRKYFKRFPRVFIDSAFIQSDEIPRFLSEKDLLILPVNFDNKSLCYIRYSMPTKVPEYMMSGTPVLLYGPPDVASIQYALKEQWGHVVTKRSVKLLEKAIKELIENRALCGQLSRRAQNLACQNHDIAKVRGEFHGIFKKIF